MPSLTVHVRKALYELLIREQEKTGRGPSSIINDALEGYYGQKGIQPERKTLRSGIRE